MAMALGAILKSEAGQKMALNLINSAPVLAAIAAITPTVQWQLEHLAIAPKVETYYIDIQKVVPVTAYDKHGRLTYTLKTITETIEKKRITGWKIKRLTTMEATDQSDNRDPDLVGFSAPILSMAARLSDEVADTAEAASNLAVQTMKSQQEGGLLGLLSGLTGIK